MTSCLGSRVLRTALAALLFPLILIAVVGVAAGRLDLPFVWALGGLLAAYLAVTLLAMDPGLAAERVRPGPGARAGVRRRLLVPCLLGQWVLAGLDVGRRGAPVDSVARRGEFRPCAHRPPSRPSGL